MAGPKKHPTFVFLGFVELGDDKNHAVSIRFVLNERKNKRRGIERTRIRVKKKGGRKGTRNENNTK